MPIVCGRFVRATSRVLMRLPEGIASPQQEYPSVMRARALEHLAYSAHPLDIPCTDTAASFCCLHPVPEGEQVVLFHSILSAESRSLLWPWPTLVRSSLRVLLPYLVLIVQYGFEFIRLSTQQTRIPEVAVPTAILGGVRVDRRTEHIQRDTACIVTPLIELLVRALFLGACEEIRRDTRARELLAQEVRVRAT